MKNRKYQWLVMTVVVCMCAVMAGVGKTAQAETQGDGARIIAYADFGQVMLPFVLLRWTTMHGLSDV